MPVPAVQDQRNVVGGVVDLVQCDKVQALPVAGTCRWMLPMPAARKSMPRPAILAHSAGSATSPDADDAVLLAADGADLGLNGQTVVMGQGDQLGGLGDVLVDGVVTAIEHDGGEAGGNAAFAPS